ncbi:MAG: sigma-54-dependent Fis family transcriptional regulator [Planctomycetes bacterium]|nr:sigma-54-dependent Fis family transcriptional regulator [Planctomycetota bacterium]
MGTSYLFRQTLNVVDSVAENDCIVLLEGESGTGKELLARRIHRQSTRRGKPFIPLNCAGVSETLFPSQLFGHVKGAFTGAAGETLGVVRAAEGGTLLLDEIGEIPMGLQASLLRLLQEHEVTPVGASHPIIVDTRFVVSTNRSLQRMVHEGLFRADLYHRVNIVRIEVPPLRTRPEDIDVLLDHYLDFFAREYRRDRVVLGEGLRGQIRAYSWPGNVRELRAYVERLYAADTVPMAPALHAWNDGYLYGAADTPTAMVGAPATGRITHFNDDDPTQVYTLAYVEEQAIRRALSYTSGNRSIAARLLDIHRSTLLRKMRHYRLDDEF